MKKALVFDEVKLPIAGRSILRAWAPGILPGFMRDGMTLREAIRAADRARALKYENEVSNLVVTTGKNFIGTLFIDTETTGATYHAIGTGNIAPALTDTLLSLEKNRKAWLVRTSAGGIVTLDTFYLAAESTYNILECGVFGGAAASASINTGTLFSRYLQTYDNSAGSVDLSYEYILTIG